MKRLLLFMSLYLLSQGKAYCQTVRNDTTERGIHFQQGLTWPEILAKAKAENKHVFVDCYATWCIPCKKMEKEVYPLASVGDFFNENFISVKMQMDTSNADDDEVKASYADARNINQQYKNIIQGYPCYLFFTKDGKILNSSIGLKNAGEFINYGKYVIDPKNDYYKLLADYKRGKRDLEGMAYIALNGPKLGDIEHSNIAKEYIQNLKKDDWFVKDNIEFIGRFIKSSKDVGFSFFFHNADIINKVMAEDGYAQGLVHGIIYKELISPAITKADGSNQIPDWSALNLAIKKEYGSYYAGRVILGAKFNWARKHKNWKDYTKYYIMFIDKYNPYNGAFSTKHGEDFVWNARAWQIFTYSNSEEELLKALEYSDHAITMSPIGDYIDTYANILYKLGHKENAINWEDLAVKQSPNEKEIQDNLEKMKRNEPTWTTQ